MSSQGIGPGDKVGLSIRALWPYTFLYQLLPPLHYDPKWSMVVTNCVESGHLTCLEIEIENVVPFGTEIGP